MRVSAVAYAFDTLEDVIIEAGRTAEVTHNHPEGIKGAQATAAASFLARRKEPKADIQKLIETRFGYDLGRTIAEIRPDYIWDISCQGTVPPAIRAFLDATGYEDAVRLAVSIGGDADTLACITGGIAAAYYGLPNDIAEQALVRLDDQLRDAWFAFEDTYLTE
jgi:ADP-ribosylglycohydrolase